MKEMTKQQAYKNLSLAEGADMETIRIRFAARYSLSDQAYDRTLTEGMKAVHEAHLRELETAYKVLTDNPVISDMGALLSLSKGYITEGGDTIGGEQLSPDEALAFFALYPHDTPLRAEERYLQYKSELETAISQIGLEASKEPFRQELLRADMCLQVAVNYLIANEVMQSGAFLEEGVSDANETSNDDEAAGNTRAARPARAARSGLPAARAEPAFKAKGLLLLGAVVLVALGVAGGLWWAGRNGGAPQEPANPVVENEAAGEGASGSNEDPSVEGNAERVHPPAGKAPTPEQPGKPDETQPDETQPGETQPEEPRDGGPAVWQSLAKLLEDVSDYRLLGEQSTRNVWYLVPTDATKRSFVVPVSSVANVNTSGTLEAKPGRTFRALFAGGRLTDAPIVPGFLKKTASVAEREALLEELARWGISRTANRPEEASTEPTETSPTVKLDSVKRDTVRR